MTRYERGPAMAKIYPRCADGTITPDPLAKAKADCGEPEYKGFTIKGWRGVLDAQVPPREYFFGADFFGLEQLQCIIGQGGLGTSRLALNMARNNVLQLPFCDQPTGTRPLRHLFIGSENDIHRWKIDMLCMSRGLTGRELDLLEGHIQVTTLEAEGDAFINLGDEDAVARWEETLERFKPDVVWVDPWGDVIDGESCNDGDIRKTLAKIIRLTRAVNPKSGVVILAHARTGRANIEQCVGYDAPNFLKDGKALYSTSRAVLNLAPYDEAEHPLIVMGFAKNNNGKKPVPVVIGLDDKTLTYLKIQDLDKEEWRTMLNVNKQTAAQTCKPWDEKAEGLTLELAEQKLLCRSAFYAEVKRLTGCSKNDCEAYVQELVRAGKIKSAKDKSSTSNASKVYGSPKLIEEYVNGLFS